MGKERVCKTESLLESGRIALEKRCTTGIARCRKLLPEVEQGKASAEALARLRFGWFMSAAAQRLHCVDVMKLKFGS